MGAMSPAHWAVVAVVLLVLFGSKRLPEAARGLGRSLRILKSEVGEMHGDNAQDVGDAGDAGASGYLGESGHPVAPDRREPVPDRG